MEIIMDQYYVYVHRKMTDGQIFYVGKGQDDRAWSVEGRNRAWRKLVADHGRRVEIIARFDDENGALFIERLFIAMYGEQLVNVHRGTQRLIALEDIGDPRKHPAWSTKAWFCSLRTPPVLIEPCLMWIEYGNRPGHRNDEAMWIKLALGHIKRHRWWFHGKKVPKGAKDD